jgi:hypothetical protein
MRTGLVTGLLLLAAPAFAGPHDFVIELAHVGGGQSAAQPYIDQFMRYAEQALGWPANSAQGSFADKAAAAEAYIAQQKPGFGIFDLEVFLALHKKYDLIPIASVKIAGLENAHLSVVVKDPKYKKLADLKGKTIVSNYLDNPKFLSRVAFAKDAFDFEKDATLQPTASSLKGLKAVRDGTAEATIVDDGQLANMKGIDPGLHAIATSSALPPTPAVSFGKQPDADKFAKMVLGMCGTANGGNVCKALRIEKFMPPEKAAYDDAVRRYEK